MARSAPRHDRDAGGPADLLAAKAALRQEVWTAMRAAKVARFPGAAGRIPNFTGAEAAADRLRSTDEWSRARTVKAGARPLRRDGWPKLSPGPRTSTTSPWWTSSTEPSTTTNRCPEGVPSSRRIVSPRS